LYYNGKELFLAIIIANIPKKNKRFEIVFQKIIKGGEKNVGIQSFILIVEYHFRKGGEVNSTRPF
jgi:hypothetical protein